MSNKTTIITFYNCCLECCYVVDKIQNFHTVIYREEEHEEAPFIDAYTDDDIIDEYHTGQLGFTEHQREAVDNIKKHKEFVTFLLPKEDAG